MNTSQPEPRCGKCGYIVKGLPTTICPECGSDLEIVGLKKPSVWARFRNVAYRFRWCLYTLWLLGCLLGLAYVVVQPHFYMPVDRNDHRAFQESLLRDSYSVERDDRDSQILFERRWTGNRRFYVSGRSSPGKLFNWNFRVSTDPNVYAFDAGPKRAYRNSKLPFFIAHVLDKKVEWNLPGETETKVSRNCDIDECFDVWRNAWAEELADPEFARIVKTIADERVSRLPCEWSGFGVAGTQRDWMGSSTDIRIFEYEWPWYAAGTSAVGLLSFVIFRLVLLRVTKPRGETLKEASHSSKPEKPTQVDFWRFLVNLVNRPKTICVLLTLGCWGAFGVYASYVEFDWQPTTQSQYESVDLYTSFGLVDVSRRWEGQSHVHIIGVTDINYPMTEWKIHVVMKSFMERGGWDDPIRPIFICDLKKGMIAWKDPNSEVFHKDGIANLRERFVEWCDLWTESLNAPDFAKEMHERRDRIENQNKGELYTESELANCGYVGRGSGGMGSNWQSDWPWKLACFGGFWLAALLIFRKYFFGRRRCSAAQRVLTDGNSVASIRENVQ